MPRRLEDMLGKKQDECPWLILPSICMSGVDMNAEMFTMVLEVSMFHTEGSWNAVDYLIHGKPLSKLYQLLNSCIVYNRNNSPGHMYLHYDQTGQIFSIISWWITAYIYSNVDIVVPLSPVHFEPRKKLCKFLFSIHYIWITANTSCAVYVHMRRLSLIHILYIFIVKYKC